MATPNTEGAPAEAPLRIPIFGRDGLRGFAVVDAVDGHLADYRWHLTAAGYVRRNVTVGPKKQHGVLMHREILGLAHGDKREGDHINRDKLDNRRCNLRVVTKAHQRQNRGGWGTTSEHRGVCRVKATGKFVAYGFRDGKRVHLGTFDSEAAAAEVAASWRAEHMTHAVESAGVGDPSERPTIDTRGGSSEYRGVARRGDRWFAYGKRNGRMQSLGMYRDELEAAHMAKAWRDYHGID